MLPISIKLQNMLYQKSQIKHKENTGDVASCFQKLRLVDMQSLPVCRKRLLPPSSTTLRYLSVHTFSGFKIAEFQLISVDSLSCAMISSLVCTMDMWTVSLSALKENIWSAIKSAIPARTHCKYRRDRCAWRVHVCMQGSRRIIKFMFISPFGDNL